MKRGLYIGIYTEGSTSKMRAEQLKALLSGWEFDIIDTDVPFQQQNRIYRSIGFRYKIGPVINTINQFIVKHLTHDFYDLIWVDKAIFLTKETTSILKQRTAKLVHYTPDMAYYNNRSKHFNNSIKYYDFLVTTKTAELPNYREVAKQDKIILITQGFDTAIHRPCVDFKDKQNHVVFIGLGEKYREMVIQHLINNNIKVVLAGYKWESFVRKNQDNPLLDFKGTALFGKAYVETISSGYFSLGLLSKHFPEMHTTRTFEIPACGTALVTEMNEEVSSFFTNDEVIFFNSLDNLVEKIRFYEEHPDKLETLTTRGFNKVHEGGFDYKSIMGRIVNAVLH